MQMSPQPAGVCLPETHVPQPLCLARDRGTRASAAPKPRVDVLSSEEQSNEQMGKDCQRWEKGRRGVSDTCRQGDRVGTGDG
jgi:hypothetical protein